MNRRQAERWLRRVQKYGYVPYHTGIVWMNGKFGINIDGDGREGRFFGCPKIFWSQEDLIEFFAAQGIELKAYA